MVLVGDKGTWKKGMTAIMLRNESKKIRTFLYSNATISIGLALSCAK
jgi:hypothetical protein